MIVADSEKTIKVGGSFLIEDHEPSAVFTPEQFTEEDHMLAETARNFMEGEIVPNIKKLEEGRNEDMVAALKKAGELGLLSTEVPENYGGMELSKTTSMLIIENLVQLAGFAVSHGAHTGIGTMPITYFGNELQKQKYLPKLASGEWLAAYCLTETSSGSDAMNARTRAVLNEDGTHYVLNGSKMWITNAGFADVFIVFAKIDGEDFTAFILERGFEGLSVGAEEKKLGIKASSTRMVILEDVKVPVENLLGKRGEGHKIAFNILNIGRYKLGGACVGGSKLGLSVSTDYAKERRAFGKSISQFGLIQEKLAEMAIKTYAQESMVYRTAGLIDQILEGVSFSDEGGEETILRGIREYAIECAMSKVYCSEAMDWVADQAVQIFGGYGYSQEYPVERFYRDSRINRIFEGTNEINRMLVVDMLLKKAMKGELPLLEKAQALMGELMGMPSFNADADFSLLAAEKKTVANAKKIALFLCSVGVQKYMDKLAEEQELLAKAADLLTETYVMETMLLRTLKKVEADGEEAASFMIKATQVHIHEAMERVGSIARLGLGAMEEGDTLTTMMAALRRLAKQKPLNTVALRREIAAVVLEVGGYPL